MSQYHDHTKVTETQAPEIEQVKVVRVTFRRGAGCCEESPVRVVTAYYDLDGIKLAELDPVQVMKGAA